MLKKIDHIAVAVKDIESAERFFTENYNLVATSKDTIGDTKICFFKIGDTCLELVQSVTKDGIIAKYIEKEGEGIHHIAFVVENIKASIEEVKLKKIRLIDQKPRPGANGTQIAFLDPMDNYGISIEFVELPLK